MKELKLLSTERKLESLQVIASKYPDAYFLTAINHNYTDVLKTNILCSLIKLKHSELSKVKQLHFVHRPLTIASLYGNHIYTEINTAYLNRSELSMYIKTWDDPEIKIPVYEISKKIKFKNKSPIGGKHQMLTQITEDIQIDIENTGIIIVYNKDNPDVIVQNYKSKCRKEINELLKKEDYENAITKTYGLSFKTTEEIISLESDKKKKSLEEEMKLLKKNSKHGALLP